MNRNYSTVDQFLLGVDQTLRALFGRPQGTERPNPATQLQDTQLAGKDLDLTSRLLRINHTSEICTQAIYQGQALTANLPEARERLEQAAREEGDHLDWCASRLREVEGHTSLLNPLLYAGAFTVGAVAGLAGDRWSLGLVAATERHVEAQITDHLAQLAEQDLKSRAILEQMRQDEITHANAALAAGGTELPEPLKLAFGLATKVVNNTVYWV